MGKGIGIYIGRRHIAAVSAVKSGASGAISAFGIEAILDNSAFSSGSEVAEKKITPETAAIRGALKTIQSSGRSFVRAGLSAFHVITRYFIMPVLPAKEKDEAIRYEASRYTRLKLTESVFGYSESSRVQNVMAITANAVKKRVVQSLTMNLRRGGADPSAIEPVYVPFSRVCYALNLSNFKKPEALLWFDSDSSVNLTLSSKNTVFLSQEFRLSGEREADGTKMHDEILGCLRFLYENAGGAEVQHILLAGFGEMDYWADFLARAFPEVQVQVVELPAAERGNSFSSSVFVPAYGLALGELGVPAPLGEVTLLPAEERKMKPSLFWGGMGMSAAAVAFFFVLLSFFVFTPIRHALENKKKQAEAPLAEYGDFGGRTLSELEMRMAFLNGRYAELSQFGKMRIPLKESLTAMAKTLSPASWLTKVTYSGTASSDPGADFAAQPIASPKKSRRLKIEGYSYLGDPNLESKQVNEWVQNLAADASFKKSFGYLALDEVKQQKVAGRSTTKFTVTAEE